MEFQDKVIVCEDCQKEFTHTAADQQRYAERGFTSEPKRCRECRQVRKERAGSGPGPRGGGGGGFGGGGPRGGGRSFDRPRGDFRGGGGGFGGGGGGYGGGGRRGGGGGGGSWGDRPPRQSFDAVCAACGAQTTLPFEPTQGRDVYCRDCYRKMKGER